MNLLFISTIFPFISTAILILPTTEKSVVVTKCDTNL